MKIFFVAAVFGLSSWQALACNQVQKVDNVVVVPETGSPTLSFRVRRNGPNVTCEYVIGFTKGSAQNGTYNRFIQRNQVQIPMNFWKSGLSEVIFNMPDAAPPANILMGAFPNGNGGNFNQHEAQIAMGVVPFGLPHGTYENQFRVQLWTRPVGSGGAYSLANDENFTLRYVINQNLALSIVSTGAPFNLADTTESVDFGFLSQNQTRSFDLVVGSNMPYSLSMSSMNGARLLRQGGSIAVPADRVAYQLQVGSTAYTSQVTLATGAFPYTSPVISPPANTQLRFPLEVKILDNTSSKNQGPYADTIVLTVTAQ
jgi:hypothetical protein